VTDRVEQLLAEAREAMVLDHDGIAMGLIVDAVKALAAEHSSTAHMAATVDPGLLGRVTELERLVGMLVKSVGALASSPQPRAAGQSQRDTGAWPFIASLDREDRPATYGPVPSPYGRPSPAWAIDCVARQLDGRHTDEVVEYVAVEYMDGEPTLQVQVSGVLYRFHAPDVLSNKGDT
jgi:hypothetical protein